ncbi:hypothetical protein ACSHUI_00025 [Bacillus subtilis]|uniref:hypothetical protein n=1 Tax=Bacillus subtilis TaxID=1423 RepID=UPI0025C7C984|nr:hypothetical protein [Bacillus subtilis]GLI90900.1 hypothetical protein ANABIO4_42520 [Bacillus subtilis]
MLNVNPKLLQQLEESACFGHAYEEGCKECGLCEQRIECSAKTKTNSVFDELKVLSPESNEALLAFRTKRSKRKDQENALSSEESVELSVVEPSNVETEKPKKKKARKESRKERRARKKAELPPDFPNTKEMSCDDLWKLLEERGGECKVFEDKKIQKMRLIMALKKTYNIGK